MDTSAWIEALRRDGDLQIRSIVEELTIEGRAVLCDMVLLELWNGARGEAEIRTLQDLESELERIPTDFEAWQAARDLAHRCRSRGLTVPSTDLLIFACAQRYGLGLVHLDSHFDQISAVVDSQ